MINRIVASVKLNHIYRCYACGAAQAGETVSMELEADSVECLSVQLKSVGRKPDRQPLGWASFLMDGQDMYKCPACMEGTR